MLIHLLLPVVLVRYVNKSLQNIPEYTGSVDRININLFRGAYVIHELSISKENGEFKEPFVSSREIDLSVEWGALVNGRIVGEIILREPVLTFIVPSDSTANQQTGEDVDWTKPIKDLMPLKVNRLEIVQGTIYYKDPSSDPKVDIYIKDMRAVATNLSNADNASEALPSRLTLQAVSIGGGNLKVNADLDIIKQVPDFDVDLSFENVDLTALNDFTKAYAKADIERGTLNFYTEVKGESGDLQGYLKPLLVDLKFVDWGKEEERNPLRFAWEFVLGTVAEIFENQKEDQFGTRIPINGSYANVKASIIPTVWNIFKNAFVKALEGDTEGSVDFAGEGSDEKKEDKKKD